MSKNKRQFLSVALCRLHLVDLLIFIQKMYFSALNGSSSGRNHIDSLVTNKASKRLVCDVLDTFATCASPALFMSHIGYFCHICRPSLADVTDTDCWATKMAALTVMFQQFSNKQGEKLSEKLLGSYSLFISYEYRLWYCFCLVPSLFLDSTPKIWWWALCFLIPHQKSSDGPFVSWFHTKNLVMVPLIAHQNSGDGLFVSWFHTKSLLMGPLEDANPRQKHTHMGRAAWRGFLCRSSGC